MKITDIETFFLKCSIPSNFRFPTASYVSEGAIFIKILTDEGIEGLGEPCPYGGQLKDVKRLFEAIIKPKFIGENPFDVGILTIQNEFPGGFGYGNVPYNSAIAGISQALWDIIGKAMDMPVFRLLNRGGDYKKKVRAYASGGMVYESEDTETLIEEVLRYKAEGYTAWKLRPPTPVNAPSHIDRNRNPPHIDVKKLIDILEKVRFAVGDEMELMIDAGCRFQNVEDALEVSHVLHELKFSFFEEPVPRKMKDYIRITRDSQIPIAGGECFVSRGQFKPWVDSGAFDILQPDSNLAGITEVLAVASMADAKGLPCIIHNWANDISIAANVQLAAAIPNCPIVEYNLTYNPLKANLVKEPLIPENGFFHLPEKPGLGVELDENVVKKYLF